jgi:chorismate synthase
VDLKTMEEGPAAIERSDTCAVPAAAVVGEAMVGLVLAEAVLDRFGGDTLTDLIARVAGTGAKVRGRMVRHASAHS